MWKYFFTLNTASTKILPMSIKARQFRSTSETPLFSRNEKAVDNQKTNSTSNTRYSYSWTTTRCKMAFAFSTIILLAALSWHFPPSIVLHFPYLKYEPSSNLSHFPNLLNAGVEELVAGLNNGSWTSVELTKVCSCILF